ncbi:MAG: sigma 54-interacting transcriptional regulator [Candidatus Sumerlaeia bacterium]|nr:sigma 54-interacting transcriptional regulator [Candidatus Sumerlaeia bacterium]
MADPVTTGDNAPDRELLRDAAAPHHDAAMSARERLRRTDVLHEGIAAFVSGEYDLARRKFQALLAREADNAGLLAAVGHCHLHGGDPAKALEFYTRATDLSPGDGEVAWGQGQAQIALGKSQAALPHLEACFRNPPGIIPEKFYLGTLFSSTRQLLVEAALTIADIYHGQGNRDAHRYWLQAALGEDPESVVAHRRLADLYIRSRNHREAVSHLEFVLDHAATAQEKLSAHNSLAIALYDIGQREQAIDHLTMVLARDPGNSTAIHNLNFIYEREGAYEGTPPEGGGELRFTDVEYGGSPIFGLQDQTDDHDGDEPIVIGRSSAMMRVMRHARVAAANDSPVLIWGESGTGKELLARLIRRNSPRHDDPFEVVQCESLSDLELESELFGHEKGAFTGARTRKLGGLELARGGTVLIEEITALSPLLQGKLLRALNDGRFFPMGSQHHVTVQARVIAATVHDPTELVKSGRIRDDLYFKLNVIPIHIPPLRERREDIPLLAEYFLGRFARSHKGRLVRLPEEDMALLMSHDWPGNVRELENLVERAIVMGSQSSLYAEELAKLRRARGDEDQNASRDSLIGSEITLEELERRHTLAVLKRCGNNQAQAARILGINASTLWRKLKNWKSG